ncbi:hypothetical protein GCM10023259_074980 [Thermocatellispora tengchongensis]
MGTGIGLCACTPGVAVTLPEGVAVTPVAPTGAPLATTVPSATITALAVISTGAGSTEEDEAVGVAVGVVVGVLDVEPVGVAMRHVTVTDELGEGAVAGPTSSIENVTGIAVPPAVPDGVQLYVMLTGAARAGRPPRSSPPPITPRAAVFRATRRRALDFSTVLLRFTRAD